jgi:hypothetical protein
LFWSVFGSVDILSTGGQRVGSQRRYRLKAKPSRRAWRYCVCRVLPGARHGRLRFTAEKTLSRQGSYSIMIELRFYDPVFQRERRFAVNVHGNSTDKLMESIA